MGARVPAGCLGGWWCGVCSRFSCACARVHPHTNAVDTAPLLLLCFGCIFHVCVHMCTFFCVLQDKLYSPAELNELMSVCDYVVMATPYTPATHQLINAAAIAAMKPNGVLVNVGRGKCIDEAALIEGEGSRQALNALKALLKVFLRAGL